MASALDLITAAYKRGRIIGAIDVPSASELADGLAELNRMLDVWRNDKLLVYQVVQEAFALSIGSASRTIGSGGNFNTSRPVKIVDGCFVRQSGVDYPVVVLAERKQYDAISVKSEAGRPYCLFYDPSYPLGTVYFHYVPDTTDSVYLNMWKALQTFAGGADAVALPPGYEDLIVDGLAIKLCPSHGLAAPADVRKSFATSKRLLGTVNAQSLVMTVDPALARQGAGYDIRTG